MNETPRLENAPDFLTCKAVQHTIGKGPRTISRLLKDGRLEKFGRSRGTRIKLTSVLRYLEEERKRATEVREVSAALGINLAKGRALLKKKQDEEKLRRALDKVNAETGIEKTTGNPTGDPRLEPCVYNGVCISVAERDELVAKAERLRYPRYKYKFQSVRGV